MMMWKRLSCLFPLFAYSLAQSCYWKSNNTVRVQDPANIYACEDTETHPGGTQLCCIIGSQCGTDGICRFPEATVDGGPPSSPGRSGWNTGGCTDPSYSDTVCPKQCNDLGRSRIIWNESTALWHCCGHEDCTTAPTNESFMAVSPQNWKAVEDIPNSTTSTSSTTTGTSTFSGSLTAAPSTSAPISNDTGLSSGAKAGIGIACGAIGVFAILAIAYFIWKRRTGKRGMTSTSHDKPLESNGSHNKDGSILLMQGPAAEAMSEQKHEVSTESTLAPPELDPDMVLPRELSTDRRRYELEGNPL